VNDQGQPVVRVTTRPSCLMTRGTFLPILNQVLGGGPAWVQGTLLRTTSGTEILEVESGQPVRSPRPSPNFSFHPNLVELTLSDEK
jgi:hypothetical protein